MRTIRHIVLDRENGIYFDFAFPRCKDHDKKSLERVGGSS